MNWNAVAKTRKTRPCKRATPSRVFIRLAPKTRAKRKPRAKARGLYGNVRKDAQRDGMRIYHMLRRVYLDTYTIQALFLGWNKLLRTVQCL